MLGPEPGDDKEEGNAGTGGGTEEEKRKRGTKGKKKRRKGGKGNGERIQAGEQDEDVSDSDDGDDDAGGQSDYKGDRQDESGGQCGDDEAGTEAPRETAGAATEKDTEETKSDARDTRKPSKQGDREHSDGDGGGKSKGQNDEVADGGGRCPSAREQEAAAVAAAETGLAAETDTHQSPPRQKQLGDNGVAMHMPKGPQAARRLEHNSGVAAEMGNGPSRWDWSQSCDGDDVTGGTSAATAMDVQLMMPQGIANDDETKNGGMTIGATAGAVEQMDMAGGDGGSGTTGGANGGGAEEQQVQAPNKKKKKRRRAKGCNPKTGAQKDQRKKTEAQ